MAAGFLGGVNVTTFAKHRLTRPFFLQRLNRTLPGAYAGEIARVKFMDEVMLSEIDGGVDELVLLGAGLDSRPYRFADRLVGLCVFEVDHPASQASKLFRLRRLLGGEPRGVRFVSVDFTREDLAMELARAGHDESAATLFIWCGVASYLPGEVVSAVLSWVGAHTSPRTSVAFDATWASVLRGGSDLYGARELVRSVAAVGECLRWGIPDGHLDDMLASAGLRAERIADERALAAYVTRTDGSLLGRPNASGVIVHARVVSTRASTERARAAKRGE